MTERSASAETPVSVSYLVSYRFDGFSSPRPGTTTARSARTISAKFHLTGAGGKPVAGNIAKSLATGKFVNQEIVRFG